MNINGYRKNGIVLIDNWLPEFDVSAHYSVDIKASCDDIYASARRLDVTPSPIVKALFSIRSFPAFFRSRKNSRPLGFTLDGLLKNGFILLEENPPHEIVLGVVGQFWRLSGGIQRMDAQQYAAFHEEGFAKAVWNFHLLQASDGKTILSTETRVLCTNAASKRKFIPYWTLVAPFSGLIRREMLRTIKRQVER